jgi:heme-degrading monooxygenase HmoA
MYGVIRNYKGNRELADQLAARSDEVESLISGIEGFHSYYLVRTEDGCATVSVYENKTGADESIRLAADWISEHASEITASKPEVFSGEVLIQAASGARV